MINRLYRLYNRCGYTLNTLFVALFTLYHAGVWGKEEDVIDAPLANRHTREVRRCLSMFTNQLSPAYRLVRTEQFCEQVAFFQRELKRGFKHNKYPVTLFNQDLAEQGGGKLRALGYCIGYYNFTYERHVAGAVQRMESYYNGEQSYKLQIILQTTNNRKESLRLSLEALRSAFTPHQLTAMRNGLLDSVTTLDRQPDVRLGDLEVHPAPHVILACGSLKPSSTSRLATQVVEHGDRITLTSNEQPLVHRQLDDAVRRVARYLCQQGIEHGQVIGTIAEHGAQTVMIIYGTLHCDVASLPLSPASSMIRPYVMCCKTQVAHILYDPAMHELTQALALPASSLLQALATSTLVREPWPAIEPQDLAYVLFTSGSTSESKGVQISHSNLANYLHFATECYFTTQDRTVLYSSLSFDLAIITLSAPLRVGISIGVCRHTKSETLLRVAVVSQPNTVIKLTPVYLRLLCTADMNSEQIHTLMVGGEDFKRDLARKAAALFPQAVTYSEYGPTEATVGYIIYRHTGQEMPPSLPIGMATGGCQVAICSPQDCPVPEDKASELMIYSAPVTQGYTEAPQQTATAYLRDTNGAMIGYRSGGTNYTIAPNTLAYQGCKDDQVKINGHRTELCKTKQALLNAPQVESAVVAVIDDAQGQHSGLLVCVIPSPAGVTTVMQHLRQQLPTHM